MMVTRKMVDYWVGEQPRSQTIADYKDLANGDYSIEQLKSDIIDTWRLKNE